MNPTIAIIVRAFGMAGAVAVLYGLVAAYMAVTDRRAKKAERERKGESDYWRTVRTDPRRSRRNWPPRGGMAA